ncbi:hypothetical protein ACS78V_17765 [Yersinia enterocolitica]|uniref:hypothetical protein n=1 Tax=Yersinia TaxID=629 RepID=UPI0002EEFADF|nr:MULTISPECIES: hypothetical protein [Yersinia]EKN4744976.1 hypothetical protein [Yersinia enterocolitica]OWF84714.1 hypothetical protein B4907_06875 [Yersinia kristensenii]CNJ94885.1 Uncharacterised protein [Yersinia frederiksenii]EKN4810897.1 hypothetical protein [Yersinia enterocolitica]CNH89298.1 Uncharacterised protein [Yersinia massiliensis]
MSKELKQKLIALLEEQFIRSDDKVTFDYVMQRKIKSQGYYLQRNFAISVASGRKGFIDCLVTSPDGQQCAIEIDKKSPRCRSLMKLNVLPDGMSGFVLLMDGRHPLRYIADGVEVIRATRFK